MQPNVTTRIQCLRHTEYLSSIARTKRGWLVDSEPLVAPASMG
ncbi:hypothetical protein [Salmonella phage vB_SenAc-pSC20]|nr:hypothetical protein [Salmonella phage vB_SenAc-pSC20]